MWYWYILIYIKISIFVYTLFLFIYRVRNREYKKMPNPFEVKLSEQQKVQSTRTADGSKPVVTKEEKEKETLAKTDIYSYAGENKRI